MNVASSGGFSMSTNYGNQVAVFEQKVGRSSAM